MAQPEFLTFENKRYAIANLDEAARAQVVNLQVVDAEINHTQQQQAILSTARSAYISALRQALAKIQPEADADAPTTH
jgi:chaperone required for assembly of F1-ATPase